MTRLLALLYLIISLTLIVNVINAIVLNSKKKLLSRSTSYYFNKLTTGGHKRKAYDDSFNTLSSITEEEITNSVATPHAGAHFKRYKNNKTNKKSRFFEGWYYRVTLPECNDSFVFIFSIEDPGQSDSKLKCVGCQVMGPNDEYLVQTTTAEERFWADIETQSLGCIFEDASSLHANSLHNDVVSNDNKPSRLVVGPVAPEKFMAQAKTGFQMLPKHLQGRIDGHDGTLGGVGPDQGIPGSCSWDLTLTPLCGWGNNGANSSNKQKSTAGWLAKYPVFEPHWQITMADARASGTINWKGREYKFENQPFYAEKNWGGAFPIKWYWAQCNSFEGYPELAVTAGGGRRQLPLLGTTEDLGMVGIHYNGEFFENVPWTGEMDWEVKPWGKWVLKGRCTSGPRKFETELIASCKDDVPGVDLRAPTEEAGLVYFCRDSLLADITLSLWKIEWDETVKDYVRKEIIIDKAYSSQGGVEVGGGPWWDVWKGQSRMKQPMKGMVQIPYRVGRVKEWIKRQILNSK